MTPHGMLCMCVMTAVAAASAAASPDALDWTYDELLLPAPSRWSFIINATDRSRRYPSCGRGFEPLTAYFAPVAQGVVGPDGVSMFGVSEADLTADVDLARRTSMYVGPGRKRQQSPINLHAVPTVEPLAPTYSVDLSISDGNNVTISNDGDLITVSSLDSVASLTLTRITAAASLVPGSTSITTQRATVGSWPLQNMTIHVRSGHTWGSASYAAELMWWFGPSLRGPTSAVVSVPIEVGFDSHEALGPVIARIPRAPDAVNSPSRKPSPATSNTRFSYSPLKFIPSPFEYVVYTGSLETPPCSTDVLRVVSLRPTRISAVQLAAITAALRLQETIPLPAGVPATDYSRYATTSRRVQEWTLSPTTAKATADAYPTIVSAGLLRTASKLPTSAPSMEPLTEDAMLSLAAAVVASTALAVAIGAFAVAVCWPRQRGGGAQDTASSAHSGN